MLDHRYALLCFPGLFLDDQTILSRLSRKYHGSALGPSSFFPGLFLDNQEVLLRFFPGKVLDQRYALLRFFQEFSWMTKKS